MSKLLINESPLQVLPSLAVAIGLPEAIVLQQVHYWLNASRNERDGHKWVYNTYEQWAEQFPFWKPESIRKIFKSLRDRGLILTLQASPNAWNKTNFYSINYEALEVLQRPENSTGRPEDFTASNRKAPPHQPEDSTASLLQETTAETTAKEIPAEPAAPPVVLAVASALHVQSEAEKKTASPRKRIAAYEETFPLPDWISRAHWNAWRDHPAHRKATDEQKLLVIDKLAKWAEDGIDHALALENSAINQWQGLFEPKAAQPAYQNRQDKNAAWLAAMTSPVPTPGAPDDHAYRNFFDHTNTIDVDSRRIE